MSIHVLVDMTGGYSGSNSATHFGLSVPVIPAQTVPALLF